MLYISNVITQTGNQEFADYVDANLNVVRINLEDDIVPTIPPRLVGFQHPSGELHIQGTFYEFSVSSMG